MTALSTRANRRGRDDDSGSMAFFLILAVVGLAMASLLTPLVVSSSRATRSDTSRAHALDAAQAGVNVMLGDIRAANSGGVGSSTLLPCLPRTGAVSSAGLAKYTVTVAYYVLDPAKTVGAQPMNCAPNYGTYDSVSETFQPKFARITSVGTDGAAINGSTAGRTLVTTYVFKTTNSNIIGGRLRIYPPSSSSTTMCLDAAMAAPIAGVIPTVQPCASPPTDQQTFAYRPDLTIQLVSSVTPTYSDGLCLDTAPPPTAANAVVLNPCAAEGATDPYTQQWSFNDWGGFTASTATSTTSDSLSTQCLSLSSQNPGTQLRLAGCAGGGGGGLANPTQAWIPSPAVGAGGAKSPQLVNFFEFGRCVDVTNYDTNTDHFIAFPCKQNPYPGGVGWNQKFTAPGITAGASSATGRITVTTGGTTYCVTSPGTDVGYVVLAGCDSTNTRQTWTVYNGATALPYSTKYTIVDSASLCLGLTVPKGSENWSAIDVETCTGATEQKWNATADLATAALQDTGEKRP